MHKGLFVLNADLSGINPYMLGSLQAAGWDVRKWDVTVPRTRRLLAAVRSFTRDRDAWRQRFHRTLSTAGRTSKGLLEQTHRCTRVLERRAKPEDVVLTFGTLFVPDRLRWANPYVVFKDYTTPLALLADPEAIPVRGNDLDRWIRQEGDVCRQAAIVFTASENTRRSVIADYHVLESRVVAVGEGLCFDSFPPAPLHREPTRKILFIGKDFRRKGGPTLLAAFRRLVDRLPDAQLTILGPPRPASVPKNVHWPGLVTDREAIQRHYRSADVFAMPSMCEPFGLVFLEAMAHGLPCIGSARDAMPEIIVDGTTGFLVEPGDEQSLAEKISLLLEDPALGRSMGMRGYERVRSSFQWSHVAKRMDDKLVPLLPCTEE